MTKGSRSRDGWTLILPASMTAGLVLLLVAIGYAAISQRNNAAFLLGFVIVGIAAAGVAHTWDNVRRLRVETQSVPPVFAGNEAKFMIELSNPKRLPSFDVRICVPGSTSVAVVKEIEALGAWRDAVTFPAERRGDHPVPDLVLRSGYPIRFFAARRKVRSDRRVLVYPKPAGDPHLPVTGASETPVSGEEPQREGDDFAGVREYRVGESQRHVDWKAVARGAPLLIKQFAGTNETRITLDWWRLAHLEAEARLSQLALWVLKAEAARIEYGLKLPGLNLPAGHGENHFHRCLRALALFREEAA